MTDTPKTDTKPAAIVSPKAENRVTEFKVIEIHDNGTVILGTDEGAMFAAELKEGLERPRKGSTVTVNYQDVDAGGHPLGALIVKV